MNRTQKHAEVNAIRDRFGRMAAAILTDFRGLDVETLNQLRNEFRKKGIEYKIVKNTLVGLATKDAKYHDGLSEHLAGPTAIAWSFDDPVAPAKVTVGFAKDHDKLKIKCAVVGNQVLDAAGVAMLSKMPGKAEVMSKLLATFMAPAQGFVRLLAAAPTNFVYLLEARKRALGG
ncbi:MAG: 50S ribosomal protein L10 [Deltaproteobacteria bacterium]|nr:50S ribosomal protein L10 [Deltaproteobacteria bacterium]